MNKRIIRLVITVLLSVSLVFAFYESSMCFGFYGKGAVRSALARSKYVDLSYNTFLVHANGVRENASLYEKAGELSLSKDVFEKALKKSIEDTIEGKSGAVDVKAFKKRYQKEITGYLKKNKVKITGKVNDEIEGIVRETGGYFDTYATFTYGRYYQVERTAFMKDFPLKMGLAVAAVAAFAAMLLMFTEGKKRYYAFGIALTSALIAECLIYAKVIFMKVNLTGVVPGFYETFLLKMNRQISTPFAVWMSFELILILFAVIRYRKWEREN